MTKILGPTYRTDITESDLANFPRSKYADPVSSWKYAVGPTDLEFYNSSKLGEKYTNNLFVGDYNTGDLYLFKINKNRDGIEFNKKTDRPI